METAFDTLRTARDLEASGFDREQAEALANAIRSAQGDLVTREALEAALASLKSDLGRELAGMESRLADKLAAQESRLADKLAAQQRWYIGLLFVAAGLAVAAMKLI